MTWWRPNSRICATYLDLTPYLGVTWWRQNSRICATYLDLTPYLLFDQVVDPGRGNDDVEGLSGFDPPFQRTRRDKGQFLTLHLSCSLRYAQLGAMSRTDPSPQCQNASTSIRFPVRRPWAALISLSCKSRLLDFVSAVNSLSPGP